MCCEQSVGHFPWKSRRTFLSRTISSRPCIADIDSVVDTASAAVASSSHEARTASASVYITSPEYCECVLFAIHNRPGRNGNVAVDAVSGKRPSCRPCSGRIPAGRLLHGCARSSAIVRSHRLVIRPGTHFPTTFAPWQILQTFDKSSAVAEMGERGHNRHGPKRGRVLSLLCPFRGALGTRLIQCGLRGGLYFRTKWRLHPSSRLATIV